jgi:hypothetical protein
MLDETTTSTTSSAQADSQLGDAAEVKRGQASPRSSPETPPAGDKGPGPSPFKELAIHPIAEAFPRMSDAEYAELKASIKERGVEVPAWTYQGKLIDGLNRYRACEDLGIELPTREWEGKGSLVDFVMSQNVHRRHLTSSQRATLAVDVMPFLKQEAEERQKCGKSADGKRGGRRKKNLPQIVGEGSGKPDKHQGEAAVRAAQLAGTNPEYVRKAQQVKEKDPELFDKVRAGTLTLPRRPCVTSPAPKAPTVQRDRRLRASRREPGRS